MTTGTPKAILVLVAVTAQLIIAGAPPAAALDEPSPLAGTWKANISKSKRHPNHLFKSATLRFDVSNEVVTLSFTGENMSGMEEKGTTIFHPDGKEHPLEGLPGAVEISKWLRAGTIETIAKKDGKVIGQSTFEVSSDGKLLTATISGTDASGAWFEQVIVCDRQ